MGADDTEHPGPVSTDPEKGGNRTDTTTPESSEVATAEKHRASSETPRMGTAKIGLIMASLMVRFALPYHNLTMERELTDLVQIAVFLAALDIVGIPKWLIHPQILNPDHRRS